MPTRCQKGRMVEFERHYTRASPDPAKYLPLIVGGMELTLCRVGYGKYYLTT